MGVFSRPDSPVWWLYIETTRERERTDIRIGQTTAQKHDSRRLAEDRYHQRMNEVAARLYKLPSAMPAVRFGKYAESYRDDVIAHRRGAMREREILDVLLVFFAGDLLTSIDQDRVRAYQTHRLQNHVSARTVNREIDLLKGMLRDAVPKYLASSPLAGMKRLRTVPPRRRLMTTTEERALLKVGDVQDRAVLILGIDTLVRLGDLLELERTDRDGIWLYVKDPKGGEPYDVALTKRAAAALDALGKDGTHYFTKFRRALNPRDWPGSVRQRLEFLCRKAGVVYGRARNGITFHWGTRRTGATRMLVQRRVPLPVVQKQGAWKKPDVLLEIYAEADKRAVLAAVGRFPKRSRAKRKSA